jgi:hypothetical protein
MLVPEMLKFPRLRKQYEALRGCYTLLDNGMFEKEPYGPEELMDIGMRYHCNEIIVNDTYRDSEKTLEQLEGFLQIFEQTDYDFNLQVVMQVQSPDEISKFIYQTGKLMYQSGIGHYTFGLPRRMNEDMGVGTRELAVREIRAQCSPSIASIHLLGLSRAKDPQGPLNEVKRLAQWVRSIDTDAPFVWADAGDQLWMEESRMNERVKNYFGREVSNFPIWLVDKNIEALDKAAS